MNIKAEISIERRLNEPSSKQLTKDAFQLLNNFHSANKLYIPIGINCQQNSFNLKISSLTVFTSSRKCNFFPRVKAEGKRGEPRGVRKFQFAPNSLRGEKGGWNFSWNKHSKQRIFPFLIHSAKEIVGEGTRTRNTGHTCALSDFQTESLKGETFPFPVRETCC